ncbi:ATP synthase subunit O, mitochondrial-like [Antedon mediterranea]|uniref:ATP synthase subunit O, mitochondrial-like n=1 Tax=Antedon mediterranea TaxID=105859 RepID=UPI003AF79865
MASPAKFSVLARKLSTSAIRQGQLVKTPLQVYGVGGRYATALYSAATKEKQLDQVNKELVEFQNLLKKDVKLADFVGNPVIRKQDKSGVLGKWMKEKKYSKVTENFVTMLTENNRVKELNDIFSSWNQIMGAHKGEVVSTITTATALDAAAKKSLETSLAGFIKKGETLNLTLKVDPSIISGMIVEVGDKYIDMSTATKVKTMTNLLKENV